MSPRSAAARAFDAATSRLRCAMRLVSSGRRSLRKSVPLAVVADVVNSRPARSSTTGVSSVHARLCSITTPSTARVPT
jgi:hypothetical protein